MRRREALAAGGSVLAVLSAGCLEALRRDDAWRELVVDPPEGVYVPPHADEMVRYGTATAVGREISLLASRPHSFWVVADAERNRADVRSRHDLHLMATVRDAETGAFVPAPVTTTIRARGADTDEPIDRRSLWPMLSQRMGAHYGDNVPLAGDGSYVATIRVGATTANATGRRADVLERETSVEAEFAFDTNEIEGLERRLIDEAEGRGEAGALEPMDHAVRGDVGPSRDPGAELGAATSGDIEYTATLLDDTDRSGIDAPILAVTPRTAYNSFPLPFAGLAASVARDGERIASAPLRETLDARLGHCYGTAVDPAILERGDELTIDLETPPQVARHEGYETAFLEERSVTFSRTNRYRGRSSAP
ncbi:iron transporter [Haloterrigena alkaliphila]|uniref:Iron transporter n=1 Tax=Haloterrigena alkaliphila TaxID=2816475 RepID=A0A8A2VCW1_9EURY|nr:iron transporter [Haloterrigena alkaliphila]QSW98550.1 iron transporter [Haloterrigena alkaliphila]